MWKRQKYTEVFYITELRETGWEIPALGNGLFHLLPLNFPSFCALCSLATANAMESKRCWHNTLFFIIISDYKHRHNPAGDSLSVDELWAELPGVGCPGCGPSREQPSAPLVAGSHPPGSSLHRQEPSAHIRKPPALFLLFFSLFFSFFSLIFSFLFFFLLPLFFFFSFLFPFLSLFPHLLLINQPWGTSRALRTGHWQSWDKGTAMAEDRPHASWEDHGNI